MQAVVAALLVAKDQRRRPGLSVSGADFQKLGERRWIRIGRSHPLGPSIRRRRQLAIHRDAQILDQRRHRAREILVLADAVAMALHHDAAAKALALGINRDQLGAFGRTQQRSGQSRSLARRDRARCASSRARRRDRRSTHRSYAALARTNSPILSIAC